MTEGKEELQLLADRIVTLILEAITTNRFLDEFDIVPVENNYSNKSPILIGENCLGLESWCTKHVYSYVYNKLMNNYFRTKCRKTKITLNNCEEVDRLLTVALLLNPNVSTFWNKRREMYQRQMLTFDSEMRLTRMVLSHKGKSMEAFMHRKWLLELYFKNKIPINYSEIATLVYEELQLTKKCAQRNPNNYHSWTYRIWLIKHLKKILNEDDVITILIAEYSFSLKWVSCNVSDYCCMHYRQFVLECLFTAPDSNDIIDCTVTAKQSLFRILFQGNRDLIINIEDEKLAPSFILEKILGLSKDNMYNSNTCHVTYRNIHICASELDKNEELLKLYRNHEALWCHRRFVFHCLMKLIRSYLNKDLPLPQPNLKNFEPVTNLVCELTEDELVLIQNDGNIFNGKKQSKLFKDSQSLQNCILYESIVTNEKRVIGERLIEADVFAPRYQAWMRNIAGVHI